MTGGGKREGAGRRMAGVGATETRRPWFVTGMRPAAAAAATEGGGGGGGGGGASHPRRYRHSDDDDEDGGDGGGGGDANASVNSLPAGRCRSPSEDERRDFGRDRRGGGGGDTGGSAGGGGGREGGFCAGRSVRRRRPRERFAKGAPVAVTGGADGVGAREMAVSELFAGQRAEAVEQLLARERERMAMEMEAERAAFRDREAAREEDRRREREVRGGGERGGEIM